MSKILGPGSNRRLSLKDMDGGGSKKSWIKKHNRQILITFNYSETFLIVDQIKYETVYIAKRKVGQTYVNQLQNASFI